MKLIIILFFCIYFNFNGNSQIIPDNYLKFTAKADSCIEIKQYSSATIFFNQAFISNNGMGKVIDRFKDANCWSILNNPDSAFFQLEKIANGGKFTKYQQLENNLNFVNLKSDERWNKVIEKIKSNLNK